MSTTTDATRGTLSQSARAERKLTKAQRRAFEWMLTVERRDRERYGRAQGISAANLAGYMWPESARRRSNSGRGSQAGVGVNLRAGAWLSALRKAGLVRLSHHEGALLWVLTREAIKLLDSVEVAHTDGRR